ncbi:nitroreductase family protein [Wielerella bovis]|uniref:nitroreductase family protein n=1 Tax=Wielerella bovis TaxID=2917790 RepID=UPI002019F07A|nr:nitroreductase family protein [Wielerella bovis]MCG7657531.1 nitroreductase family protein [Wielerella bovis]MCG7659752.1 nitroreductase family protein [Wielerella bovis]
MTFFNKDDVLNAFHYRASTRSYDGNKKISAEDFQYILELGRLSPSSVGSEPWRFLVLQNADLRQKLKPYCWGIPTMETASHIVAILAKKNARYDSAYFDAVIARCGLTGEAKEKALAVYKQFQEQDIAILDNEHSLKPLQNFLCRYSCTGRNLKFFNTHMFLNRKIGLPSTR